MDLSLTVQDTALIKARQSYSLFRGDPKPPAL